MNKFHTIRIDTGFEFDSGKTLASAIATKYLIHTVGDVGQIRKAIKKDREDDHYILMTVALDREQVRIIKETDGMDHICRKF